MTLDPVRAADGRELDAIALRGLTATGHHGVLPAERRDGQVFRADVVVHVDTRAAAGTDDLARTVNYATLAEGVVAVLAGEPVDLVETLAQRIAEVALALPAVEVVDVVVHKPEAPIPVPFEDVTVAVRRRPARATGGHDVVLALGGNVGDVRSTLRRAIADLDARPGLTVRAVSPLARTGAVGPAQADYLNAVVTARTTLTPRELLALTSSVEDAHGRTRQERWGPRTLDIDIVAVDAVISDDPVLRLPHPRARERAFVLAPWSLVDPEAVLPGPDGGRVADLAAAAPDRDGVRWVAPAGWHADTIRAADADGDGDGEGTRDADGDGA
jgi:dihydroneopterin aldolase/2-amino-4-hydroxy-6-hydroxymethyldihydropteridine diphosphokinase